MHTTPLRTHTQKDGAFGRLSLARMPVRLSKCHFVPFSVLAAVLCWPRGVGGVPACERAAAGLSVRPPAPSRTELSAPGGTLPNSACRAAG